MKKFAGKTALVTGAGRGIGREIAHRLAREGALVAVHYCRNDTAAETTVDSIRRQGGACFLVKAELGGVNDVETLYSEFDTNMLEQDADPGIDIIVNNAAVSLSGRLGEITGEQFDRLMAVNARAPLFIAQEGAKRLRDGGRIVNVSSAVTKRAFPDTIAYAMSKAALEVLTLNLAQELGGRGITVNAVAPGFVETEMNARRRTTPEARAAIAAYSVFERIGRPDDIAAIVAFLASDDARWITGQCIDATGGSKL